VVIVQPFFGSVKEYIVTVLTQGCPFAVPERCPHPDCQAAGSVCGRTHSLLPGFLHPHRHFVIDLLQQLVSWYLLVGLGWRKLLRRLREAHDQGPAYSTVREWLASFAYGAGHLLLDALLRHLLALDPGLDLPDLLPEHLDRVPDPNWRRRLENGHTFWLLAEQLYAQVKQRQPDLHFSAAEIFPFLLHWLQGQRLPPRLFWSPRLATTPSQPF
jgi:hypothetical protein